MPVMVFGLNVFGKGESVFVFDHFRVKVREGKITGLLFFDDDRGPHVDYFLDPLDGLGPIGRGPTPGELVFETREEAEAERQSRVDEILK